LGVNNWLNLIEGSAVVVIESVDHLWDCHHKYAHGLRVDYQLRRLLHGERLHLPVRGNYIHCIDAKGCLRALRSLEGHIDVDDNNLRVCPDRIVDLATIEKSRILDRFIEARKIDLQGVLRRVYHSRERRTQRIYGCGIAVSARNGEPDHLEPHLIVLLRDRYGRQAQTVISCRETLQTFQALYR
jgi:hypothetical protein